MTHYLVRHTDGDIRLHSEDGSEPLSGGWDHWPTVKDIANKCAAKAPDGSLLGRTELRSVFIDAVSGGVERRDLTIGQTLPWEQ